MLFKKGEPRPPSAGRKKGTRNKVLSEVAEMLHKEFPDYDPIMAMAKIARDETIDLQLRITCHKEVAQYIRPKLRSTIIEGTIGVVDLTVGEMPK